MLAWLSGGSTRESTKEQDHDVTAIVDVPDTPAHLFVARAFKHSLWGTPQVTCSQKTPSKDIATRGDNATAGEKYTATTTISPSKANGILLTPGAASLRRAKSVTFGNDVTDQARDTRYQRTPNIRPGSFTSLTKQTVVNKSVSQHDEPSSLKSKFLEARTTPLDFAANKALQTKDTGDPVNVTDWRGHHEEYAKRTQREMKRLIAKQQAAKRYAREKDNIAMSLTEQLQQERKKALKLEAKVVELSMQLKRLGATLSVDIGHLGSISAQGPDLANEAVPFTRRKYASSGELLARSVRRDKPFTPAKKQDKIERGSRGDMWAEAILSSPIKAQCQNISPSRVGPAEPHSISVRNPLRERALNTPPQHCADPGHSMARVAQSEGADPADQNDNGLDLSLSRASSPFLGSPDKRLTCPSRTNVSLREVDRKQSSYEHDKAIRGKQDAEVRNDLATPRTGLDRTTIGSERAAKARERIAARRRARNDGPT